MRWIWRRLLTWLLALAMPVQGIAAAGMQHCAPTHERLHAGAMASVAHGHGHGHGQVQVQVQVQVQAHSDGHGDESQHATVPADATPAAAEEAALEVPVHAAAAASSAVTGDAKCSLCTACCVALGLSAAGPVLAAMLGGPGLSQPAKSAVPSFVPDALERPPRFCRA